ncbi:HpcH/HpaI aldolase/citrate lyase family protein [Roseomonas sp. BN140053]|uniref:HpcH/HpaI aldolase/citrate lyase family protein n=1 Tax=Roseomonas sp. BN140053 TaxID=3391898 RepID=UPI0039ED3B95
MIPRTAVTWRSLLYVPANVPRFVAKAAGAGADAVILDLEDSVPPDRKLEARAALAEAVPAIAAGGAEVLVRINQPLRLAVGDIEASMAAGAHGLLVTKCEGAQHLRLVAEAVASLEKTPGTTRLVPVAESARALSRFDEMATADPRVVALLLGTEDLAADIGCEPDEEVMLPLKHRMVVAAAAAGITALGLPGTVATFGDEAHVAAMARRARRFGFGGATCIHPKLVPILNAAFTPDAEEVAAARRVVDGAADAAAQGRGSVTVDGRMVDEPVVQRAQRVLRRAEAAAQRDAARTPA